MTLPASFYRAEAAYLEPPEPDYEPDFEDGHELPSGHVDARTCWNKDYRCRVAREAFALAGTEPYVSAETRRDTEAYE